jgi:hypothetical protein
MEEQRKIKENAETVAHEENSGVAIRQNGIP